MRLALAFCLVWAGYAQAWPLFAEDYPAGCYFDGKENFCYREGKFDPRTPVLENPTSLIASGGNFCAIDQGKVKCWGPSFLPLRIEYDELHSVVAFDNKPWAFCGLQRGQIRCFTDRGAHGTPVNPDKRYIKLISAYERLCALGESGEVDCWLSTSYFLSPHPSIKATDIEMSTYSKSPYIQMFVCALEGGVGKVHCKQLNGPDPDFTIDFGVSDLKSLRIAENVLCASPSAGDVHCRLKPDTGEWQKAQLKLPAGVRDFEIVRHRIFFATGDGKLSSARIVWDQASTDLVDLKVAPFNLGPNPRLLGKRDGAQEGEKEVCWVGTTPRCTVLRESDDFSFSRKAVGVFGSVDIPFDRELMSCAFHADGKWECRGKRMTFDFARVKSPIALVPGTFSPPSIVTAEGQWRFQYGDLEPIFSPSDNSDLLLVDRHYSLFRGFILYHPWKQKFPIPPDFIASLRRPRLMRVANEGGTFCVLDDDDAKCYDYAKKSAFTLSVESPTVLGYRNREFCAGNTRRNTCGPSVQEWISYSEVYRKRGLRRGYESPEGVLTEGGPLFYMPAQVRDQGLIGTLYVVGDYFDHSLEGRYLKALYGTFHRSKSASRATLIGHFAADYIRGLENRYPVALRGVDEEWRMETEKAGPLGSCAHDSENVRSALRALLASGETSIMTAEQKKEWEMLARRLQNLLESDAPTPEFPSLEADIRRWLTIADGNFLLRQRNLINRPIVTWLFGRN